MKESDDYFDHAGALVADDLHPFGEAATALLIEALELRPGQRVLELGCGTGKALARLCERPGLGLVGLDRSLSMLRTARFRLRWTKLHARPRLVRGDARRLPFVDAAFDAVYAESVVAFQAGDDARAMIAEAHRVLRPGGRLVVNEAIWREGTSEEQAARAHAATAATFGIAQASREARWIGGWRELFADAGFEGRDDSLLEPLVSEVSRPLLRVPGRSGLALAARRAWAMLQPQERRRRRRYRQAEAELRAHGDAIEARLFVLRRPSGASRRDR